MNNKNYCSTILQMFNDIPFKCTPLLKDKRFEAKKNYHTPYCDVNLNSRLQNNVTSQPHKTLGIACFKPFQGKIKPSTDKILLSIDGITFGKGTTY